MRNGEKNVNCIFASTMVEGIHKALLRIMTMEELGKEVG